VTDFHDAHDHDQAVVFLEEHLAVKIFEKFWGWKPGLREA
jgi:hypothetical protein